MMGATFARPEDRLFSSARAPAFSRSRLPAADSGILVGRGGTDTRKREQGEEGEGVVLTRHWMTGFGLHGEACLSPLPEQVRHRRHHRPERLEVGRRKRRMTSASASTTGPAVEGPVASAGL